MGELAILNVASGDTKLTFDTSNIAETIRASRIVKDMLKRGYALLIEVERDGEKRFERALDFDETKGEYIIADFDPAPEPRVSPKGNGPLQQEEEIGQASSDEAHAAAVPAEKERECDEATTETGRPARRGRRRGVPAESTRAVAVARSAGG